MGFAMFIVGLVLGVVLVATVAVFGLLNMEGRFTDNARLAAREAREVLSGRARRAQLAAVISGPDGQARLRALQEEVRVMQRLMDKARSEAEAQTDATRRAREQVEELRDRLSERDERLDARDLELTEATAALREARDQLHDQGTEVSRLRGNIRDLENELGLLQSGVDLAANSS